MQSRAGMDRKCKGGLKETTHRKVLYRTTPDPAQTEQKLTQGRHIKSTQKQHNQPSDVAGEKKERKDINRNKTPTSTQTMSSWDTDYLPNRTSASETEYHGKKISRKKA